MVGHEVDAGSRAAGRTRRGRWVRRALAVAAVAGGVGLMTACDTTTDDDGDGVPNFWENYYKISDPKLADTDGDGTDDGSEDFDEDGLTNEFEVVTYAAAHDGRNLDPTSGDSDGGGVSDFVEVTITGTDPLNALDDAA
jgi:hypothetical protein